jgi:rhamnose transport system permease protein
MSILVILSCAQMMVVLTRSIDLSIGSMVGLVAMSIGLLVRSHPEMPIYVAVLLSVLLGGVLGLVNAVLVALFGIPSIIATLGTLQIYRGIIPRLDVAVRADQIPSHFIEMTRTSILGIPSLYIYAAIIAASCHFFLSQMRMGRQFYAIGSNPEAAVLAGIRPRRAIFIVFVLSGLLSGFGGAIWLSHFANAESTSALGVEFQTVASNVIGGVNVFGGSGTILGVVTGTLLLGIIRNAMVLAHISALWQEAVQGLVILAAVTLNVLGRRVSKRGQS